MKLFYCIKVSAIGKVGRQRVSNSVPCHCANEYIFLNFAVGQHVFSTECLPTFAPTNETTFGKMAYSVGGSTTEDFKV